MTIAISVASLILAISALARTIRSDRRRLLFELHSQLISPDPPTGEQSSTVLSQLTAKHGGSP
jgi:hypothetical protein